MAIDMKTVRIAADQKSERPLKVPAWVIDSGVPGPNLLLTAAQHGNEVQGCEVLRRFVALASTSLARGKVVAVPFANLPAVRERRPHVGMGPEQPYADNRGHNMNRCWPGDDSGNTTERLCHAIYSAFGDAATHVLDLHCWSWHNAPAVLIGDAPALRTLAGKLGNRFVEVRGQSSLSTIAKHFCDTGRVGLTYEFSGQYEVVEDEVTHGLRVVVNMARAIGMLPGRRFRGDVPVLFSDECDARDVTVPRSGLFVEAGLKPCDPVDKGDLLGHILSDRDLETTGVRAPASGYLRRYGAARAHSDVALPGRHPYVSRGDRIATLWIPKR